MQGKGWHRGGNQVTSGLLSYPWNSSRLPHETPFNFNKTNVKFKTATLPNTVCKFLCFVNVSFSIHKREGTSEECQPNTLFFFPIKHKTFLFQPKSNEKIYKNHSSVFCFKIRENSPVNPKMESTEMDIPVLIVFTRPVQSYTRSVPLFETTT